MVIYYVIIFQNIQNVSFREHLCGILETLHTACGENHSPGEGKIIELRCPWFERSGSKAVEKP